MRYSNGGHESNEPIAVPVNQGNDAEWQALKKGLTYEQERELRRKFQEVVALIKQYGDTSTMDFTAYKISMVKTMQAHSF